MTRAAVPAADSVFAEFPARTYLEKYYSAVGPENDALLRSITDYASRRQIVTDTVIEVAGGPCLFSLMALAAVRGAAFEHVTFTDIGWRNLREVDAWLRDDRAQFQYTCALEWLADELGARPADVTASLRDSRWDLTEFDWRQPVPAPWEAAHDVVSCHFFAESATDDENELVSFLAKVRRLARPGGTLLLSFMCRSSGYTLGRRDFPAFGVDRKSIFRHLERGGLDLADIEISEVAAENPASNPGYDGLLFVGGRLAD